jgi:hypothetical protein
MIWPMPHRDDLEVLPIRAKGDWEGMGYLLAAVVWSARLSAPVLGLLTVIFVLNGAPKWFTLFVMVPAIFVGGALFGAAKIFMENFSTYWFGTIYHGTKTTRERTRTTTAEHEAVHHWQRVNIESWGVKYLSPWPTWRRHAEAQAYALDVVAGRRSIPNAVMSMSSLLYFMWSKKKNHALLLSYVDAWNGQTPTTGRSDGTNLR